MRRFRLAAAVMLVALSVSGCAAIETLKQTWAAATSVVVNKTAIKVAVSAFNGTEALGTVYIKQKRCPPGIQKPTCMSPPIRETIAVAIGQGRDARDKLLDFVDAHPDAIGDQGLYDALKAATATLKNVFAAYNIGPQT